MEGLRKDTLIYYDPSGNPNSHYVLLRVEAEDPGNVNGRLRDIAAEPVLLVHIPYAYLEMLLRKDSVDTIYRHSKHVIIMRSNEDTDAEGTESTEDEYYELFDIKIRSIPPDCLSDEDPFVRIVGKFKAASEIYRVYTTIQERILQMPIRNYIRSRMLQMARINPKASSSLEGNWACIRSQETTDCDD